MSSFRSDVPLVPLFSPSILIVPRAASLFPSSLRHCLRVNLSLASLQQIITVLTTILVSLYTFYITSKPSRM